VRKLRCWGVNSMAKTAYQRERDEREGRETKQERSLAALGMTGLGHNGSGRSCGLDGVHWRRTKKFATGRRFLLTLINAMVYSAT